MVSHTYSRRRALADISRVQIAGCSVSFGLVAIWCMHFVGNRAIVLGDGEDEIQLYYSSTFTAISAIIPVVVIFLGLMVADRFYRRSKHAAVRVISLIVCGLCAGAAITEMHYLGNNGTTNYRLQLSWPHVFGAAGIAVGASLLSFGLFFHWSGSWLNNIVRRAVVACFLAFAVSGMHWTGAAGTWYEVRGYHDGSGQERNITLIIALCLVRPSHRFSTLLSANMPSVLERLRCLLPPRFSETTPPPTTKGPCTTSRTRVRYVRRDWQVASQPEWSLALSNDHSAIPSEGKGAASSLEELMRLIYTDF